MNRENIPPRSDAKTTTSGAADDNGDTHNSGTFAPAPQSPTTDVPRMAYSIREAAEMLGVSEKSVRRLIDRRLLRPSRALRHLLIPKKEIERFLEETTVR